MITNLDVFEIFAIRGVRHDKEIAAERYSIEAFPWSKCLFSDFDDLFDEPTLCGCFRFMCICAPQKCTSSKIALWNFSYFTFKVWRKSETFCMFFFFRAVRRSSLFFRKAPFCCHNFSDYNLAYFLLVSGLVHTIHSLWFRFAVISCFEKHWFRLRSAGKLNNSFFEPRIHLNRHRNDLNRRRVYKYNFKTHFHLNSEAKTVSGVDL